MNKIKTNELVDLEKIINEKVKDEEVKRCMLKHAKNNGQYLIIPLCNRDCYCDYKTGIHGRNYCSYISSKIDVKNNNGVN
jgi:hypothetical protein